MSEMELPTTVSNAAVIEAFEKLLPGFDKDRVFEVLCEVGSITVRYWDPSKGVQARKWSVVIPVVHP